MTENDTQKMLKTILLMQADISARLQRIERVQNIRPAVDGGHIERMDALGNLPELLADEQGDDLREALRRVIAELDDRDRG